MHGSNPSASTWWKIGARPRVARFDWNPSDRGARKAILALGIGCPLTINMRNLLTSSGGRSTVTHKTALGEKSAGDRVCHLLRFHSTTQFTHRQMS